MSIWLWDVPLLIVIGMILARIHGKWLAIRHPDFFFHSAAVVIGLFWLNAILTAFGMDPWLGAETTVEVPGWIALFYVLSYPMWFLFGAERVFATFGRRPTQGGFLWPFTIDETTKPFQPPWKDQP